MACSDCIDVILLHKLNILLNNCIRHIFAVNRIVFHTVYTFNRKRFAVYCDRLVFRVFRNALSAFINLCICIFYLTKSKLLRHTAHISIVFTVK